MYVVSEIIIMKSDSFSLRLSFEKSNKYEITAWKQN